MVVALYFKQPKSRNQLVLAVLFSGLMALIFSLIFSQLYDNPRPFVSDGSTALISHGNDNGFPSQHTVFAATSATMIFCFNRRWGVVALAAAVLVGWGRVAAHVHHTIDILAGLAIGLLAGYAGYHLAKKIVPTTSQPASSARKP